MSTLETAYFLIFNILGLSFLLVLLWLLVRGRDSPPNRRVPTATLLVAAALTLFFGNAGRFESFAFSLTGFQAKTRELQGVLDQAKATVESLNALAIATAELQVDMLAAEGRFGGGALHKDALKDQLLTRLKALGLTQPELDEVDRADRQWVIWDYVIAVLRPLNSTADAEKGKAYTDAFNRPLTSPMTPDECAALLERFKVDDEQTKQLLADYRYYFDTGKQRRPNVWRDRDSW